MPDAPTAAPAPDTPAAELSELCRTVLRGNWRQGRHGQIGYAYTAPSPGRYPWQWYWDSCFAAIVQRRFDPARSRLELESLLAAARPDGFIGHITFWGAPVDRVRSVFYNVESRDAVATSTIQPPLLAWAWRIAVGDPAEIPAIGRHQDSVERERDLAGDGLLWIIQPDESGLDASPAFDSVWTGRNGGTPGFSLLVGRNRRLGFDPRRVLAAGGPLVCDPSTNVLHNLSRLALGRPSLTPTLIDRLYNERTGRFGQLVRGTGGSGGERGPGGRGSGAGPAERFDDRVLTWAALSPLALPDLPQDIGRRLVEEHLLNSDEFRLPFGPPSVARSEPTYSTADRRLTLRRYWRGPTWINAAWLLWLGLVRLGYQEPAQQLADQLAGAVLQSGLREYYHPVTGTGMGARDFAWSSLCLEMADPAPGASRSYL